MYRHHLPLAQISSIAGNDDIAEPVTIDGAHGEGGGQVLRTALALSAITLRPFRILNIRAKRRNPGLLPQHLSAARAAAAITGATLSGDRLGSSELAFAPTHPPQPGCYVFDVAEIAGHGSAGSTILILQTIFLPLALAQGPSTIIVRGGTHLEWAPTYDDFANGYLPALRRMGLSAEAELTRWGWYPAGGGEVRCRLVGKLAHLTTQACQDRSWRLSAGLYVASRGALSPPISPPIFASACAIGRRRPSPTLASPSRSKLYV